MTLNSKKTDKTNLQSTYAGASRNPPENSWTAELIHIENKNNREDAERLSRQIADINTGRAYSIRF